MRSGSTCTSGSKRPTRAGCAWPRASLAGRTLYTIYAQRRLAASSSYVRLQRPPGGPPHLAADRLEAQALVCLVAVTPTEAVVHHALAFVGLIDEHLEDIDGLLQAGPHVCQPPRPVLASLSSHVETFAHSKQQNAHTKDTRSHSKPKCTNDQQKCTFSPISAMDSISASTFAGSFARVLASGRRMSDTGSSITRAAALARTLIGRRVRSCAGTEARRGGRARRRVGRRARQCEAIGATLHAATTLSSASVATALLPSRRARAQHTHTQKAKAPTRRVARRPSRKAAGTSLAAELQAVRLRRVVSGPSALSPPDGRWQRLEGCARSQVKCTGRANPRMEDVLNQPLSQSNALSQYSIYSRVFAPAWPWSARLAARHRTVTLGRPIRQMRRG